MRRVLGVLALVVSFGVSTASHAGLFGDEIRIGVVTDLSGIYADFAGNGLVSAVEMAVDDVGGEAAGQSVEVIVADSRLNTDHALEAVKRLHQEEDIDMLTGIVASDVALAVQAYGARNELITMNTVSATANLTGRDCSPYGVHWTYDTWALSAGSVGALVEDGSDQWFFLVADYEFGKTLADHARRAVEANGAATVGRAFVPYKGMSFVPQLQEAMFSGADTVALAQAGGDLQRTIREMHELGLQSDQRQAVALLMFLTDIRRLGLYLTAGLKFTTGFYWDRNAETRAWAERFSSRTGNKPTMAQAGAYSAVRHYLLSVDDAGTTDSDTVMAAMRNRSVNDFFANNGRLRRDGRMVHDMYLVEVKSPSESRRAWDYLKVLRTIPKERAFRPIQDGNCPLAGR